MRNNRLPKAAIVAPLFAFCLIPISGYGQVCYYDTPCVCPQELITQGDGYWLYYSLYCPWDLGDGEWASPTEHADLEGMCPSTPTAQCVHVYKDMAFAARKQGGASHQVHAKIKDHGLAGPMKKFADAKVDVKKGNFFKGQKPEHIRIQVPTGVFFAKVYCIEYKTKNTGMTRYMAAGVAVSDDPGSGTPIKGKMVDDYVCVVQKDGIFFTVLLHELP